MHPNHNPEASYALGTAMWGMGVTEARLIRDDIKRAGFDFVADVPTILLAFGRLDREYSDFCEQAMAQSLAEAMENRDD